MNGTVERGRRRWGWGVAGLVAAGILGWAAQAPLRWHQWQPRLEQADAESALAACRVAGDLRQNLKAHADQADQFAERLLSWRGKWALLKSQVPGSDASSLRDFIQRVFEETVLSGADVEAILRRAAVEFGREQQAVGNRLLLDLRLDLDLPGRALEDGRSGAVAGASSDPVSPAAWEHGVSPVMRQDVIAQAAILAGTELAGVATVQLALSAGVLGTGGALAPETLGLSLVAGILADLGLSRLYRAVAAPEAKIAAHARHLVMDMADRLVEGTEGIPGIRARLEALAVEENARRREVLRRHLFGRQKGRGSG